MASSFYVNHVDSELGEKVVADIRARLKSMKCSNSACNDDSFGRVITPSFGIEFVKELNQKGTIVFTSSSWCCDGFMHEAERMCFISLTRTFTSDKIIVKPNHFIQE